MLLLDTMVVSESFKTRPEANVVGWLRSHDPVHLYVSVITFGEYRLESRSSAYQMWTPSSG